VPQSGIFGQGDVQGKRRHRNSLFSFQDARRTTRGNGIALAGGWPFHSPPGKTDQGRT
jgi:hypothetical protein